jgi:hypothetical protein
LSNSSITFSQLFEQQHSKQVVIFGALGIVLANRRKNAFAKVGVKQTVAVIHVKRTIAFFVMGDFRKALARRIMVDCKSFVDFFFQIFGTVKFVQSAVFVKGNGNIPADTTAVATISSFAGKLRIITRDFVFVSRFGHG